MARLPRSTEGWLLLVIAAMCLILGLATDTFWTLANAFDLLNGSATNVIFAVGLLVNMSNSDRHNNYPLPNILVGGGAGALHGGRHIDLPANTTLSNLLLTILNKAGIEETSFADSTGAIAGV
jgi:hypothetical protein